MSRLVAHHHHPADISVGFRKDATYLITGGFGGLGLLVARWMVERGAKHLVLLGRRSPDESAVEKLKELEQAGSLVVQEKADVSEWESMTMVLERINQSALPLAGVIHAAGMLSDGVLQNQSWSSFEQVMASKVQGSWYLHKLTQNYSLDFFVLFSSVASLFGSPGQVNHSAANAFLDGLAHYRRSIGLPGLSIHWGPVAEVGEAAERGADLKAQQQGMEAISPTQVIAALELLISGSNTEVGVVPIDWSIWKDRVAESLFLQDWKSTISASDSSKSEFLQYFEAAVPSARRDLLVAHVSRLVVDILGLATSQEIDLRQGLFDLGMDSLTAIELRSRLQKSLGFSVSSNVVFNYPTIEELVNYLIKEKFEPYFLEEKLKEDITVDEDDTLELEGAISKENIAELLAKELEISN
ncbi:MAG: SDR family NAD(P)-dependent oxidoreductase [Symploca sp. SIO2G7]|nr:SDR family NAD(P)-dependent oxidoreductase [Symploca sp. SIO2G7]